MRAHQGESAAHNGGDGSMRFAFAIEYAYKQTGTQHRYRHISARVRCHCRDAPGAGGIAGSKLRSTCPGNVFANVDLLRYGCTLPVHMQELSRRA